MSYLKYTRHAIYVTYHALSYQPKTHSIIPINCQLQFSYSMLHTPNLASAVTMVTHAAPTMGGIATMPIAALPETDLSHAITDIPELPAAVSTRSGGPPLFDLSNRRSGCVRLWHIRRQRRSIVSKVQRLRQAVAHWRVDGTASCPS